MIDVLLLIYAIQFVIVFMLTIRAHLKYHEELYVKCILESFFFSLFSPISLAIWTLSLIADAYEHNKHVVLWKTKKKQTKDLLYDKDR